MKPPADADILFTMSWLTTTTTTTTTTTARPPAFG